MKILLSFLQDQTLLPHSIASYRFWINYMKNGISEARMTMIEVPNVDWAAGLVHYEGAEELYAWQNETWTKTLSFIKENRSSIDIFISYLYPKQIDVNAIREIQKLGIPCVNFYCDNVREFTVVPKEFKVFDLIWVPEYEAIAMYKAANQKYINLPMPIWVDPKYRNLPTEKINIISFIGTKDALRNDLLASAIQKKLPIEIYGNGWVRENSYSKKLQDSAKPFQNKVINQVNFIKRFGLKGFLFKNLQYLERTGQLQIPDKHIFDVLNFDDYITKTQESLITLGINRVPSYRSINRYPVTYSRLRDLEATMLGACYLTEQTTGLKHLYELGTEIETYKSKEELIGKCQELLGNPERRKILRKNGQQRALNDHSIPQTLLKIKSSLHL